VHFYAHVLLIRGYLGLTVSKESFTDPDFASNVSLLVSMSEIVVLVQDAAKILSVSCVQNQQDQNYVTVALTVGW